MKTLLQRARMNRAIRSFFEARDFLEVETGHLVKAAGTDPYIDPLSVLVRRDGAEARRYLHTSPEFAMKGLLADGAERIYQLCHVFRDGEWTPLHRPEFMLLEWYRAGAGFAEIMDDVEELVGSMLGDTVDVRARGYEGVHRVERPFPRVTMRELWLESCGIDPIESAGDVAALADQAGVTSRWSRWDELFFDLMLERVEPWLRSRGPVFVTEWPVQLAVLARRCPHDDRVAERFELYFGGVELANGFGELTCPVEQRERFEGDNVERRALGKEPQPIPEQLLAALERGLPECSGVAVGVDRLLMLIVGATHIDEVVV